MSFSDALDIQRIALGPTNLIVANTLAQMASVCLAGQEMDQAIILLTDCLRIRISRFGPEHEVPSKPARLDASCLPLIIFVCSKSALRTSCSAQSTKRRSRRRMR